MHTKLFSSSKNVVDLKLDPLVVTNLTAAESIFFNILNACLAASHTESLTQPPLANPSNSISTNNNKTIFLTIKKQSYLHIVILHIIINKQLDNGDVSINRGKSTNVYN